MTAKWFTPRRSRNVTASAPGMGDPTLSPWQGGVVLQVERHQTWDIQLGSLRIQVNDADPAILAKEDNALLIFGKSKHRKSLVLSGFADKNGVATFTHLPPGTYRLQATPFNKDKWENDRYEVEIQPGDNAITLDYHGQAPQHVTFQIRLNGGAFTHCLVAARKTLSSLPEWLGDHPDRATWEARLPLKQLEAIEVYRLDKLFRGRVVGPFNHTTERTLEFTIELRAIPTSLLLPADLQLPHQGRAAILIKAIDQSNPMKRRLLPKVERGAESSLSGVSWNANRIELGLLPAGRYEIRVGLEACLEETGRTRWKRQGSYLRATFEVTENGTAEFLLE